MEIKCRSITEVALLAGEWSERTGRHVISCDDPNAMEIGFTNMDDEDPRRWSIEVRNSTGYCDFWTSRRAGQQWRAYFMNVIHTDDGRKELRNHVDVCAMCCVDDVIGS